MKKFVPLFVSAAICVGLLAGCSGAQSSSTPDASAPSGSSTSAVDSSVATSGVDSSASGSVVDPSGSSALQYIDKAFNITNSTGVDIVEMSVSVADSSDWDMDVLGGNVLAAGATMEVTFEFEDTAGLLWDMMVVDEDGNAITFKGIDLSASSNIELVYENSVATVVAG